MRLLQPFGLAFAYLSLGTLANDNDNSTHSRVLPPSAANAERPVQAYDVANPTRLNATTRRDAECKSCPYGNCLNVGIIWLDIQVQFQCFTQGEAIGNTKTWLRYQFGGRQDEFCYVNAFDLQPYAGDYSAELPYCGTKSELHLYLPSQQLKTVYYTECSICPYRDCEGIKYYPSGALLNVNCEVNDGWLQLGPLHPDGSKKYYRTPDNCYVSVQTVAELPARVINIAGLPSPLSQDVLPPCGPVPHIRVEDRPGLVGDAFVPFRPYSTPSPAKPTVAAGPKPVTIPISYNQGATPKAPGQISRLNVTALAEERSSNTNIQNGTTTRIPKEMRRARYRRDMMKRRPRIESAQKETGTQNSCLSRLDASIDGAEDPTNCRDAIT